MQGCERAGTGLGCTPDALDGDFNLPIPAFPAVAAGAAVTLRGMYSNEGTAAWAVSRTDHEQRLKVLRPGAPR